MPPLNSNKQEGESFYVPLMYLGVFFAAAVIGADILTYKLISIFGFTASAAVIFFPLTYTIGDIVSEVYGRKIALCMVFISVCAELYVDTLLSLVSRLHSPAELGLASAFTAVLEPLQGVFWGNLIALAISAMMNVVVMSKLRGLYKGQFFIIRSLVATFSSEIVFIIIAYSIWFVGRVPAATLFTMMAVSMAFKIIYAFVVAYPAAIIKNYIEKA